MAKQQKKGAKRAAKSKTTKQPAALAKAAKAPKQETGPIPARMADPRIPPIGSTLTRVYKGKTITVEIKADGFWHDGTRYNSLSAIATKLADGTPKNGLLWFGLNKPKQDAKDETSATPAPKKPRAPRKTKTTQDAADGEPAPAIDEPAAVE